jgi:NAD-dependent deacetylase
VRGNTIRWRERRADRSIAGLNVVARALARARRVLVVTGAGMSVAAGLPPYRGVGGLYTGADGNLAVPDFLTAEAMPAATADVRAYIDSRRLEAEAVRPTAAHVALAQWIITSAAAGRTVTLSTMNVDDLHERAASEADGVPSPVHHLHGSAFGTRCLDSDCGWKLERDDRPEHARATCAACGGPTRPDVVLFGEELVVDAHWQTRNAVRDCDALLVVGSSMTTWTVPKLLRHAHDVRATTIAVDPAADACAGVQHRLVADADEVLPLLLTADSA